MRKFSLIEGLVVLVFLIVFGVLAFGTIDWATGMNETRTAIVVDKDYTPSRTTTSYQPTGTDGMMTSSRTSTSPEKYTLILRDIQDDVIFSRRVSPEEYGTVEPGDRYQYTVTRGGLTDELLR